MKFDLQLFGGLFGSKKTSTQKTEPYTGEYANQINDFYKTLKNNLNTSENAYTGNLSTGLTDTQKAATNNLSSLIGNSALTDTANGKYLDVSTNPYLSQTYDLAADKVSKNLGQMNDNINSQFNTRGIYNSSARRETLQDQADQAGDILAGLANNIYGTAYNNERTNQINATNNLATLNNSLFSQGSTEQGLNQTALDKEYTEWLRQQGVDDDDITNMLNYFGLVKNPTTTTTENTTDKTAGTNAMAGIATALLGK